MARNTWLSTTLALGMVGALIYIFSTGEPRLPPAVADGSYFNPCCGHLTLRGGELRADSQVVSYVIERDKGGAYVLPKALVAVANNRLEVDRTATPLKLRLNRESNPSSIEVMDRGDGPTRTFARFKVR